MNKRIMEMILIVSALALLCLAPSFKLVVQAAAGQEIQKRSHKMYALKDLGTLGGPSSNVSFYSQDINRRGMVAGTADMPIADPANPGSFLQHAFRWQNGVMSDLGTLPGGSISFANWINERGEVAGQSQTGLIDPSSGAPATAPVLWKRNGEIVNLGTLGGGQGLAVAVNASSQVIGAATNTIPDDFSLGLIFNLPGFVTQTRAFLWQRGVLRDLGTLGGSDGFAMLVNEAGQAAGISYTNSIPNDTTGIPTLHPFLWEGGSMRDLGSLGGTFGIVNALNNRGQVAGDMTLAGDEAQHPFFWNHGKLIDLGTFGGSNGSASWLNDAGEVVGTADLPDGRHHAFFWKKGVMTDLGTVDVCSTAWGINSNSQVVGASGTCGRAVHAFLWERDSIVDLNTLIPAGSGLQLVYALSINDEGEIVGLGVPPGVPVQDVETRGHAFLLTPMGNAADADSPTSLQSLSVGEGENEKPTRSRRADRFSRLPLLLRRHDNLR